MPFGYGGFYDTFARFYDAFRQERPGEIEFYRAQARAVSGGVLEVGCGTGLILIPMAEEGLEAWGIDSSEAMLAILRAKLAGIAREAPERAPRIELRRADMRDFSLERLFGLVAIPYHTFQHLRSRQEQRICLECIRRHLGPGGRLVMDVAGFDPADLRRRRGGIRVERRESIRDPDVAGELETVFAVQIDPHTGLAVQTRTLSRGADVLLKASTEVRYLRDGEAESALEKAGFRVLERSGGFRGEPLGPGGEQVWIAERV